jgi:Tol biopolymer transport system component
MTLSAGMRLGPYQIVSALGAGGMGEVYRAQDTKLHREVALKVLPDSVVNDPDRVARFSREARVLASLNHPHIAQIHGLEESDRVRALVMELVEGPTLADRIARGPIPMHEALAIARQIADALDSAHDQGVIHRDLKPANIKVREDDTVKVLDFGLAKALERLSPETAAMTASPTLTSPAMTGMGVILGTAAYMSPEQARGKPLDKRTDIWAFGCVLYEMLTGRRAFAGDTVTDTFVSVLERQPDWATLPSETPASIRTLLDRCLRKDPRKRLHDIADALIELDDVDRPASGANRRVAAAAPPRTRERLAWIVAAVLGVVSCAMAVLYIGAVPPAPGPLEFTIGPPENWVFTAKTPAPTFEISPDGLQMAVAASSQGVSMLWVRPIANPAWRQLPGTQGADSPFWSPDSQSLGFLANEQLKTVKVSGSEAPVIICEARLGQIGSGAWSRDGVIVFGGTSPLRKVAATSGGNPTPVTTLQNGEIAHRWPSLLPDGEHFLYLAQAEGRSELRVGSLASTVTTSLGSYESHAVYASGYLMFVRSGRLMAQPFDTDSNQLKGDPLVVADSTAIVVPWQRGQFSVSATGVLGYSRVGRPLSRLTWMDRSGKTVGTAGDPGLYVTIQLSPDDRRVAVSQVKEETGGQSNVDIWLIDLARAGTATRLTDNAAREYDPTWSPDGSQVAFNSSRIGERFSLWRRGAGGSGDDELLVKSDTSLTAPDWSREGRFLVYTSNDATGGDLWTLPLTGDRKPEVFLQTSFAERSGTFSPDGHWIAYTSNVTGRSEVYVRPFPVGEGVFRISRDGGREPRWREDGRELFFVSVDGMLMAAGIETTKDLQVTVPQALFHTGFTSLETNGYDAAKDGQRFLIPVRLNPPGSAPITVVLNWPATLRK